MIVLCVLVLCLGERCIHFSDSVIKVNRKGRTQERWLMITGKHIHAVCIPIKGCVLIPEIVMRIYCPYFRGNLLEELHNNSEPKMEAIHAASHNSHCFT